MNNNNQANQAGPGKSEIIKKVGVSKEEKKNALIGGAMVILVILAIIFFGGKKKEHDMVSKVEGCAPGDLFSQTTGEPCFPENAEPCQIGEEFNKETGEPCPVASAGGNDIALTSNISGNNIPSSYDNALLEYKDKSILFDASCMPIPAVLEVPIGTRVLVANNSALKTLDFKVLERTEDLSAFHYMLSGAFNTVGEYPVSCDGKVVATIKVK